MPQSVQIELTVNGEQYRVDVPPGESLLVTLRERLGFTGAKAACGEGACGACSVLVGGAVRYACIALTLLTEDPVTTVEGLFPEWNDLAAAFADTGGFQCGFCTPGQMVHAAAIVRSGETDEASVRSQISGNICRCTGYQGIVQAIVATVGRRHTDCAQTCG